MQKVLEWLWRPRGPRTDVARMSRGELFKSARQFLAAGIVLILVGAVLYFTIGVDFEVHPVMAGVAWMLTILGVGGLCASSYLALRGILRRRVAVELTR